MAGSMPGAWRMLPDRRQVPVGQRVWAQRDCELLKGPAVREQQQDRKGNLSEFVLSRPGWVGRPELGQDLPGRDRQLAPVMEPRARYPLPECLRVRWENRMLVLRSLHPLLRLLMVAQKDWACLSPPGQLAKWLELPVRREQPLLPAQSLDQKDSVLALRLPAWVPLVPAQQVKRWAWTALAARVRRALVLEKFRAVAKQAQLPVSRMSQVKAAVPSVALLEVVRVPPIPGPDRAGSRVCCPPRRSGLVVPLAGDWESKSESSQRTGPLAGHR